MGFGNFLMDMAKKTVEDAMSSAQSTKKFKEQYKREDTATLKAKLKATNDVNCKRAIAQIIAERR